MTDRDLSIPMTALPPAGAISKKPPHLILLEDTSSTKSKLATKKFITTDKPDIMINGIIQAKGIFVEVDELEIAGSFSELLLSAKKEDYMEMMFPLHRVINIRNLVFKAK